MDGAGAAARDAAAVLGAGEPDIIAQDPQERGLRLDVHGLRLAVDVQGELHDRVPLSGQRSLCASQGACQDAFVPHQCCDTEASLMLVLRVLSIKGPGTLGACPGDLDNASPSMT